MKRSVHFQVTMASFRENERVPFLSSPPFFAFFSFLKPAADNSFSWLSGDESFPSIVTQAIIKAAECDKQRVLRTKKFSHSNEQVAEQQPIMRSKIDSSALYRPPPQSRSAFNLGEHSKITPLVSLFYKKIHKNACNSVCLKYVGGGDVVSKGPESNV